jgi:hypothetical protein
MICANSSEAGLGQVFDGMRVHASMTAYAYGDRAVTTALRDRVIGEGGALAPHDRFTVHVFHDSGHLGPGDPRPVTDVLRGLPLRPPAPLHWQPHNTPVDLPELGGRGDPPE